MPVLLELLELRFLEFEVPLDAPRPEVEVLLDNFTQIVISFTLDLGTIGVDEHRKGLDNTDLVRDLDELPLLETLLDQGLLLPPLGILLGPVDLGGVLTGELTATVSTPATVGVDDNLPAGQTLVTVGAANDEPSTGVDVVDGVLVEVFLGDDFLDYMLHNILFDLIVGHFLVVLGGDQDGVNPLGDHLHSFGVLLVLTGDLGLTVGPHPGAGAFLPDLGQLVTELSLQTVRQGHQLGGLVGLVTEHVALVTLAKVLRVVFFQVLTDNTLFDIGGLLLQLVENLHSFIVQTLLFIIVANVLDLFPHDLVVVDFLLGGDLTKDHNHTGLGAGFALDPGEGIFFEALIQHLVGDLVAQFVGVTLVHGLTGEQKVPFLRLSNIGHFDFYCY